ncbi:MAG: hypothetical protein JXQ83_06580 [Candidatus Glassbacteria bacterium]|nr:hypothetical protein [Candidatus Glassbacteria bacterium]
MRGPRSFIAVCAAVSVLLSFVLACSPGGDKTGGEPAVSRSPSWVVVEPGTHPGLLFSAPEIPALRQRIDGGGLAAEAWQKVLERAEAPAEGDRRAEKLAAMALVYQVTGDREAGRAAVELLKTVLAEIDPFVYHREIDSDFFATDRWPIPLAYAWDWLYQVMDQQEKALILGAIENWIKALYEHTESWWWQEASYNCGAIPVGALGLACTAIQAETSHPEFEKWFSSAVRRIRRNFFPNAWRDGGICWEGPCYAIVGLENPVQFGEALRRTGGPDILSSTAAMKAMQYLMFQWLPQEGCAPIGDNTNYGRRVFAAEYLLGIGATADGPGLWTFERYTDRRRLDPLIAFLWYPAGLEPVSPADAGVLTSRYFEITRNRAGYLFSRSRWDDERSAFFAFATRYENQNHQHYDMNTFLFSAFGEDFGTHKNIFPYGHEHHGVDFEHNIVIVDQGGMPADDRSNSCGDDASMYGLLTGLGTGHFADYVRGDAKDSYQDRSLPSTLPAMRAERCCLFAKQGPNPYLLVADDIQKSGLEQDYHWQWYAPVDRVSGAGTPDDPLLLEGDSACCAISFIRPAKPEIGFEVVRGGSQRYPLELGLVRCNRRGLRVQYVALAAAWEKGAARPEVRPGPAVEGCPGAVSLWVEGETFRDLIVWQPEEDCETRGEEVSCGGLATDGFLAMVRTDRKGKVSGYVLGDGTRLDFGELTLVSAPEPLSVSADDFQVHATGRRQARQNLPPLPAAGKVRKLQPGAAVYADGELVERLESAGQMVKIGI